MKTETNICIVNDKGILIRTGTVGFPHPYVVAMDNRARSEEFPSEIFSPIFAEAAMVEACRSVILDSELSAIVVPQNKFPMHPEYLDSLYQHLYQKAFAATVPSLLSSDTESLADSILRGFVSGRARSKLFAEPIGVNFVPYYDSIIASYDQRSRPHERITIFDVDVTARFVYYAVSDLTSLLLAFPTKTDVIEKIANSILSLQFSTAEHPYSLANLLYHTNCTLSTFFAQPRIWVDAAQWFAANIAKETSTSLCKDSPHF